MWRFVSLLLLVHDLDGRSVFDAEYECALLDRTIVPKLSEEPLRSTSSRYEVYVSLSIGSAGLNEQPTASIHI